MKALSIIQPWASLIALGAKKIETRVWPTNYRGKLAIHASKRFPEDCGSLCFDEPFKAALAEFFSDSESFNLPTGAILATATIIGCVPVEQVSRELLAKDEGWFGNYEPGRWAWLLTDVRRLLQPIQCNGALGLWTVPAEIEEQLNP
jgi:activating signal cointegrator 1